MSMPLVHSSSYIELSMYVYNCKTFFSFTFRSIKYKVYCANCARHLADDHGLKLFFEIEWLTVVLQRCLPFFELSRVLLFAHKKSWKLQHVKHKRSTTRKKSCVPKQLKLRMFFVKGEHRITLLFGEVQMVLIFSKRWYSLNC